MKSFLLVFIWLWFLTFSMTPRGRAEMVNGSTVDGIHSDGNATSFNSPSNAVTAHDCCITADDDGSLSLSSSWQAQDARRQLPLDFDVTNHEGKRMDMSSFLGRPLLLSFAYTQCTNTNKCMMVTRTLGELQALVQEQRLHEKTRIALMTYDPKHDTPAVLTEYMERLGLKTGPEVYGLIPDRRELGGIIAGFGINAALNQTGVALHGIQLLLIDSKGRLVKTYHTIIWNNNEVLKDLGRLIDEEEAVHP